MFKNYITLYFNILFPENMLRNEVNNILLYFFLFKYNFKINVIMMNFRLIDYIFYIIDIKSINIDAVFNVKKLINKFSKKKFYKI